MMTRDCRAGFSCLVGRALTAARNAIAAGVESAVAQQPRLAAAALRSILSALTLDNALPILQLSHCVTAGHSAIVGVLAPSLALLVDRVPLISALKVADGTR